jgi:hypothetical protein
MDAFNGADCVRWVLLREHSLTSERTMVANE